MTTSSLVVLIFTLVMISLVSANYKIPCMGLLGNPPVNCTWEELKDGMAGIDQANKLGLIEKDNYEFLQKMTDVDFQCAADLINKFYGGMDAAPNFQEFFSMIRKECPNDADLAQRSSDFYDAQKAKVATINSEKPECAQPIYNWESEFFTLFQKKAGQDKVTAQELLLNFANFYKKLYKEIKDLMDKCETVWTAQFPNSVAGFNSPMSEAAYRMLEKTPQDKLAATLQTLANKFMSASSVNSVKPDEA